MSYTFDIFGLKTPYYATDLRLIKKNLEILRSVQNKSGAKILLAQKAFSLYHIYPLISNYLYGTAASSLFEAKLGKEEMGGETHIFSPAYKESEIDEIVSLCDHVIFNSFAQWNKFKDKVLEAGASAGIRVNPGYSEVEQEIYNPCAPRSRLGITKKEFEKHNFEGLQGLHFHTLCEQNSDALERTIPYLEKNFGDVLKTIKWLNLGGGHHITRSDYDTEKLVQIIKYLVDKYGMEIYLEPGEAIALDAGFLVAEVVDIVENDGKICILDTSAACHMPDVIEMPYRPRIIGAGLPDEFAFDYRLGGPTCLSGDIIGDYSFPHPLEVGDRLVFEDMAIYSMVKNNTFNGINLPSIALIDEKGALVKLKDFGYLDFKSRL